VIRLALLATLGCSPLPISDASDGALEIVAGLVPVEAGPGPILVIREDRDRADSTGVADQDGCIRKVRIPDCACPVIEAHEIGHALGLDHVKDRTNVMDVAARGTEWSDAQRRRAEIAYNFLVTCPHEE